MSTRNVSSSLRSGCRTSSEHVVGDLYIDIFPERRHIYCLRQAQAINVPESKGEFGVRDTNHVDCVNVKNSPESKVIPVKFPPRLGRRAFVGGVSDERNFPDEGEQLVTWRTSMNGISRFCFAAFAACLFVTTTATAAPPKMTGCGV